MENKMTAGLMTAMLGFAGIAFSSSAISETTNFTYSKISAGVGKGTYDTPVCIAGECYTDMALVGLSGSFQFANDMLVAHIGSQVASNSGETTKLSSSVGYIGLGVVMAVGDQVDIKAVLSSLSGKAEACLNSICSTYDDTGIEYGVGVSAWFDQARKFAGHLNMASSKYSKDTKSYASTGVGFSFYPNKHHEIRAGYSSGDSSSSVMGGYAYHF